LVVRMEKQNISIALGGPTKNNLFACGMAVKN
jgi:hypothetical protein